MTETKRKAPRTSATIQLTPGQASDLDTILKSCGDLAPSFTSLVAACFALGLDAKKKAAQILKGKGKRS